ncbi:hypothetical protein [Modicisalibacter coralii]|uniref:hypothetical protein n=1 Tax=Modicisalibacter coralii TaxID=2304602 RepID=UPI00100AF49B|nr:hypothetical protein [Halomonas coralii]
MTDLELGFVAMLNAGYKEVTRDTTGGPVGAPDQACVNACFLRSDSDELHFERVSHDQLEARYEPALAIYAGAPIGVFLRCAWWDNDSAPVAWADWD